MTVSVGRQFCSARELWGGQSVPYSMVKQIDEMTGIMYITESMNALFRKTAAWLMSLFLLVGIVISSSGGVLCVGEDGQVKIKSMHHHNTADCDQVACSASSGFELERHSHCGDCSDRPLDGATWIKPAPPTNLQNQQTLSLLPSTAGQNGELIVATAVATQPGSTLGARSPANLISSIVLRC